MQKRFLWLGPPLLAAGIFLFALAGDFRAQENPPGGKAPGTQKLDNTVRDFLYEIIEKGRVVYNKNKDYQGCARIYGQALLAVLPLLDHHPDLQKTIGEGLTSARQNAVAWQEAVALRKILDTIRAKLGGEGPPVTDKKVADKGLKVEGPPTKDKPFLDLGPDKIVSDRKVVKDKVPGDRKVEDKKPSADALKKDKVSNPDEHTIFGRVTYQGKPLSSGFVTLIGQDGRKFSASIKTDGSYRFRGVTVPPGEYRVVIDDSVTLGKGQPRGAVIPQRYRNPETSGLTARINRGENIFDLALQ
jgi:hypothetical protein